MKMKTLHLTTWALLPAALFTLTSCSSPSTTPPPEGMSKVIYTEGVPGGTIIQTVRITATVTAIDQTQRTATLRGSQGKKFTVKVGPEAINFDQIHVGDQITATVTEKIDAHLDATGAIWGDGAAAVVAGSPKGAQPGGLVAGVLQVTARVMAIDSVNRTATLQFEDGFSQTFPVRADVDLSRRKVGEQVVFHVTEMVAINVVKLP